MSATVVNPATTAVNAPKYLYIHRAHLYREHLYTESEERDTHATTPRNGIGSFLESCDSAQEGSHLLHKREAT